MKMKRYIIGFALAIVGVGIWSSCEDMLEPDSEYVLYDEHLNGSADTATSLIGILYKLQAIADRVNLLGEVRGDLVKVNSNGSDDLRKLAQFDVDDDNEYNDPTDFYAVINNCNYYIAYADTTVYDSRGTQVFEKEIAQVKAIRAWTYLQLVLAYGKVPFYTDPLLTEQDAEEVSVAEADRKDIEYICDYFITELEPLCDVDWPQLHYVNSVFIPMCYYPVDVVLGDLYLWKASILSNGDVEAGQSYYREAARCYWNWIIDERSVGDGLSKSIYYVDESDASTWSKSSGTFGSNYSTRLSTYSLGEGSYGGEYFTVIPMDSASHQGYYSQLRSLYNSTLDDDAVSYVTTTNYSLEPSDRLKEISMSQHYCYVDEDNVEEEILTDEMQDDELLQGDLRLAAQYSTNTLNTTVSGYASLFTVQNISKTNNANVGVQRQRHVWLRFAEALNNGGFPRLAHMILANGLDEDLIADLDNYMDDTDQSFIDELNGGSNYFINYTARTGNSSSSYNSIGLHSLGCGYAEMDSTYAYPEVDSMDVDSNYINGYTGAEDRVTWAYQNLTTEMASVDSLIITEAALETAFEGRRLYDLIRYAKRYNDNSWVYDAIGDRDDDDDQPAGLRSKLMTESNWYLNYEESIGY